MEKRRRVLPFCIRLSISIYSEDLNTLPFCSIVESPVRGLSPETLFMGLLLGQLKRIPCDVKPSEAGSRRRVYRDIFTTCLTSQRILFKCPSSKWDTYCTRVGHKPNCDDVAFTSTVSTATARYTLPTSSVRLTFLSSQGKC